MIAGDPTGGSHFNGKLDSPKVWRAHSPSTSSTRSPPGRAAR